MEFFLSQRLVYYSLQRFTKFSVTKNSQNNNQIND